MAEIHVLPIARLTSSEIDRLSHTLAEAHAAGVDLGPRSMHVQMLAAELEQCCEKFRTASMLLVAQLSNLGMPNEELTALLRDLPASVERMVEYTRTRQLSKRDDEGGI